MDTQTANVVADLERKYGCPVWVTNSGDLIPLTVMGSQHLTNAWNMLCRNLKAAQALYETNEKDYLRDAALMRSVAKRSHDWYYFRQCVRYADEMMDRAEAMLDANGREAQKLWAEAWRRGLPLTVPEGFEFREIDPSPTNRPVLLVDGRWQIARN